ncbi:hypothetical protein WAI453_007744 [Rhynchosporium graminicola]|uniref:Uncharacterized protein n=1 Tax=Rhynchosporium graminicola TaxID=2792576 RepID=A0A1E1L2F7_9HELO|nr:uncharacterized protein RCO7_05544 [Rhynchosporium commune]
MPRSGIPSRAESMHYGLPIILWIVQLLTVSVYIYTMTFLVARMAVKGDLGVLGPSYLTTLIFFLLLFILLANEAVYIIRQTLDPHLYFNSQVVKISLFVMTLLSIEVFGLAWKKRDTHNAHTMLTGIIGLTLLASIPFSLSLVLAWSLQRTRGCGIAIIVTPVEEEYEERRPLLGIRAYTT